MATPVDPAVLAQLTELFPETPQDILMAVVEHCGSLESCTEALLQMNSSDPIPPTSDQMSADEAFARSLLDEEVAAARATSSRGQQFEPRQPIPLPYKPYVSRRKQSGVPGGEPYALNRTSAEGSSSGQPQGKDELDEIAESFSKLAQQGQQKISFFLGKVKEQIQKLDQPSTSSYVEAPLSSRPPLPPSADSWTPPPPSPSALSKEITLPPRPVTLAPERVPLPVSPAVDSPLPAVQAAPVAPATVEREVKETTPEPKKDFSHLGLLPRQSVSLLESEPSKSSSKPRDSSGLHEDEDDDELEYVRSPFDDDD